MNRIVGMKNYGPEWFTTYGLSCEQAADLLTRQGVDLVVIQNLIDPLPTSMVEQEVDPDQEKRFSEYSDEAFRDSIRARGIEYYEAATRTSRTLLATLQTKADYLQNIYAAGKRHTDIPFEEHLAALSAVTESPADGVMVYHWKDYLQAEAEGDQRMSTALRAFKEGALQSRKELNAHEDTQPWPM